MQKNPEKDKNNLKKKETLKKKITQNKDGAAIQSRSQDPNKKVRANSEKRKSAKKQSIIITSQIQEQIEQPIPPPDQPMTEVKLGFLSKFKLFFTNIEMKFKMCLDGIMNRIYNAKEKSEYKRKEYSMKYFPLEEIVMCLDEYLYKFERIDNKEEFNKSNDSDEESIDEDDQETIDRQKDRNKYFQFWQWNYMVTDNQEDKNRKKNEQLIKQAEEVESDEEEESEEEQESDDEDDIKNQHKIQSQFSIKLKEVKKEYSVLKKEVKVVQKTFRQNNKEMRKIEEETGNLALDYDNLKDSYSIAISKNKLLQESQKQVFEVKDSIKHIRLKQ